MSTPNTPPPPGQPPAGGFGAPQDVPPGGFGAPMPPVPPAPPHQPPAPPAPPAAPPTPPAAPPSAQPAYGYPQTGDPGYGYPQQPGTPAPFSAPSSPGMPVPAPQAPAAGGGDKRTQLMIVGAALLAIVLIVGGGFWYTSDNGGGTNTTATDGPSGKPDGKDKEPAAPGGTEKVPSNPKSKTLLNLPSPTPEEQVTVEGSWLTDSTYVKSDVAKVVGYNLVDGGKKWETALPAHVCGATKHISDNKSAILFDEALPSAAKKYPACTQVGVIDLESGKLLWSATAKSSTGGDKPVKFDEVTISGQTVAAGGLDGGAAWTLTDGKPLWTPKVDNEGCKDVGYAGGDALAVMRSCGRASEPTLYAQLLDATTGAPKYSYKLSPGIPYAGIISTKPVVIAANVGNTAKNATNVSDLFVLDDAGQLKARIGLSSGNFAPDCPANDVEKCTSMVVGNGKVYLPSYEHQGSASYGRTNELLSFDLETGKQTTDRADAGERYTIYPLRMDGSNVIAYKVPPYDKGGQVVSIDGKTMKETVLMENPADKASQRAETSFLIDHAEFRYHNGKLFLAQRYARKPTSAASDPDYHFVSFTAS
ncbi:PQQ-like beta-propeller repeat protein [Streptomyces sp. APSN-46.1]|uniref:outer membrane protein assembly factor BamB family protein n=1 Tax=Streptomyces sp. APSN-46.1 TaxID=2929049 RepID=UPI001FB21537|nr:PQQ-binding-like beta-propeller repeat protein [Streptomyces sp. APSN-46.1]MCJ1678990.1 PQQ-like beta-propeller repeat protein [Streptomyces sp. APSN-46.1]